MSLCSDTKSKWSLIRVQKVYRKFQKSDTKQTLQMAFDKCFTISTILQTKINLSRSMKA